jgi:hypothetical protein
MQIVRVSCALLLSACGPLAYSQKIEIPWEAGAAAGYSWHSSKTVAAGGTSAQAGLKGGIAVSGNLGHNMYRLVSGEVRYTFQKHDLELAAGGTKTGFAAQSHAIHYDFLIHGAPVGANVRPFVAVGGGVRYFRGTGSEAPFQPLSQYAILTKTSQWLGMGTVGGGAKFRVGRRTLFRAEVRYYITPFPDQVIAPRSGAGLKGWLHNIVPMAGISYTF